MNVAASVALAVAERVERTGGPRAGLVAWRTLASSRATDSEVRGKALLAALRCALALRDEAALSELTALWETVDRGVWDGAIYVLCKEMVRGGFSSRATTLAEAEVRRHRTARALYCHARCLDLARDAAAADVFRDAIARAEKEGAKDIELASRVRRSAILARSWHTMSDAIEEARRVDVAQVPAESRLVVARVLLRSPSRFERAGAIGILDTIITAEEAALATRALTLIARWADDAGDALTPLESDRVIALFGRERVQMVAPNAKEIARVLERIARSKDDAALRAALDEAVLVVPELGPLHERTHDILAGRFEVLEEPVETAPSAPSRRRAVRHAQILDVVVAMRDRAPARAARTMRILAEAEEAGEHLPLEVLSVVQAALGYDDPELRETAAHLVAVRLRRASTGAPPRGFLLLADTLASLGMVELSLTARRAAVVSKEPGAAESLGTSLAREGWELARVGDREQAIQKLREAKALLEKR